MDQALSAACEIFLIPSAILFAALAVATNEQLKALVSLMGVATTGAWFYRVLVWTGLSGHDKGVVLFLAGVFLIAWLPATVVHGSKWYQEALQFRSSPASSGS